MTREEAITYGERKKASIQEKLCRDGSSYGDYSIYYSEMEFTSAALSALREQEERRWIPVTERLPDDSIPSTFYLCYWNGYIRVCKYWRARKVFELRGKTVKVTHWMPLPEPPKGD